MIKPIFKVSFFLWKQRTDKDGNIPVYISSRQNSKKLSLYNTGVKVKSHQWDNKSGQPVEDIEVLTKLKNKLQTAYRVLVERGEVPTLPDLLKAQDLKPDSEKTIVDYCDEYIANKQGRYSAGTIKAVHTLRTNLKEWRPLVTFAGLKPREYLDFLISKRVQNNSASKRITALKLVAIHAEKPLIPAGKIGNAKNVMVPRLTLDEVRRITKAEPSTEIEKVAKNVFMLACFSGLRIGDLMSLDEGTLEKTYYRRTQGKTDKEVLVTLHKYNTTLFKHIIQQGVPYSRQRLSGALNHIFKKAGIDEKITRTIYIGGKREKEVKEKWECIAFHSGRRFYARFLTDLGVNPESVRDELGHGFENITAHYAGHAEHKSRVKEVSGKVNAFKL